MDVSVLDDVEARLLRLLADQKAISVDHLAPLLGLSSVRVVELVSGLEGRRLVRSAQLLTGESRWVWSTRPGIHAIGANFVARKPRLGSLRHMHAINEIRVQVEGQGVPGLVWLSERRLWSGSWTAPSAAIPDAVVEFDGERHAIEAELSRKKGPELHEKLSYLSARFDRVVYFAAPEVRRLMLRLELPECYPKLVLRELEPPSRTLDRPEWRVAGDPEPPKPSSAAAMAVVVTDRDRAVMRLLADQYAIPMDQLGEFLRESEPELEERVRRYMQGGLVQRGRPTPAEPAWVWLRSRGMTEAGYELSVAPPRLGGLERLRAINDIRLEICGPGSGLRWVSGRLVGRQERGKGAPPVGVVEFDGERHAVDVWTSLPEPERLAERLERRAAKYDAVVWFYSRRACARVEVFAQGCRDPRLVVRPIPKVDMSGLRPSSRHPRAARRPRGSGPKGREEVLWERLREAPPRRMVPVTVESVAREAIEELRRLLGLDVVRVLAAWQRPGKGQRLYRLETDAGVFRVVRSGWGWRADVVRDEGIFDLQPGEPRVLNRRDPRRGSRKVTVEPAHYEFGEEVWAKVRPLIPPIEERMGRRGRRPVSDRAVLSAMVWRLRHGGEGEWPAALLGFKTSQVLWRRCREWKELGAWEPIRVALERELPDSAALDFSRFPLAWSSVRRQALNGRQRQLLCRLQGERTLAIRGREYASAGGITPGLAMLELRELVRRELLVGRCRRRPFWFWAPRDLCARLVVQGMDALVVGDDADWRPVPREWTGDRPLEVLRVICEQRAVEVGLLARICGLETAELGDALVDLYRRRLIDSELAVGDWPWVWPRRRGALLVEAVRWGRPSEQELPLLQAANAARALFAERCRDGEWVAAEELRVDMRAAEVARVPTAVLEVMGADGLLRRHAIEVDVASAARASCVEDAVAAYAEHYDVVDLVCGPDAASSARAARPAGVEVWELPAPPPPPVRADEEGWLSELEEAAPGDKRRGWRYPLRVYEGRQRVHLPGGPAVVYGVELSSLPGAARSAIAEVVGSEEDAYQLEVWKKDGGGKQVFCVRTTSAVFRVVGGAGRWRADEVLADGVFDKRPRRSAPKRRRLPARGPKPVYEIDVEEFPSAGVEAVRVTAEAADPLVPRAVWQSFGGGAQIYCVECAAGAFRVVRSRWGWRADRAGQGVFLKHGRHERPIGARLRTVVYELEPEAVPAGLGEALVAARGGAEVEVRRVWRRPRTRFVYCVETAEGTFRAQRDSRWGWQVEPAAEAEFDRRPGPMPGPDPKCHIVEPERFEVDDEVWERIEPSIPEPGGSRLHRGKVVYSDRAIVSGLLYFLRNDLSSWRRLPTELGFGTQWACPRRVGRWENLGVWEQIRAVLERELPDGSQLDFSRVRGRRR